MTDNKCEEVQPRDPEPGGDGRSPASKTPSTSGDVGTHSDSGAPQTDVSDQGGNQREGATPVVGPASPTAKIDKSFIKPANDDMSYKHFILPNGLRVLLVSDPTTDKAGAAMDVRVGSLSDPDDLPGLAHFTEHMLFYSSEKYPEEDEYTKFISDRGGTTNAYTASEHTNYHFDINWESLAPALDRFAQFFIAPTISRDGIEREVKAVDSEHGKNLLSDPWRKSQISKATANPRHPWARFSTGNQETLYTAPLAAGTDPRDAVVEFYGRHYSADRCALAVVARQPVEELEGWVRSMFSAVPTKQLPPPAFGEDVFLGEQLGVLIRIVPVKEGQSLELTWQVPPSERLFREQPLGYLSHLLGHEGEGSVFALLKAAGWASALWAGESGGSMSFVSFFTIHVDLTDEGQRRIKDVATTVFRYLALLRRPGGINERTWEEVRGLAQLQFDTRDRSKPLTYATTLASGLQLYPPKDLLPAVYGVPMEFSPSAIRESLELLTPQRVRALWISKVHINPSDAAAAAGAAEAGTGAGAPKAQLQLASPAPAPAPAAPAEAAEAAPATEAMGPAPVAAAATTSELLTEPVYGTRYDISALQADWLAAWEAAQPEEEARLHLPAPNRFIPTDLSLADDEAACSPPHPTVALAVPGRIRLWHKPETRFRQPKAVLFLDVQSPEAYTSPRAAVMTRIFTKLMLDYLNEVAYPAQQAGLDYNVVNTQSGWQLLLSGYNHKLPELLREVLERLADFKVLPDRFEFVREGLVREYANQLHNQPYSWAMYRAEMLTTARRWPIEVYGSTAASISADELQTFVARLCSRCFVEGLAAGNLRRAEALRCGALLLGCLRDRCGSAPLHPAEAAELRMLRIPPAAPTSNPPTSIPPAQQQEHESEAASTGGVAGADGASSGGGGGGGGYQRVSGGWLFAEEVPSGQDENSAALVMYQVGPDDLRANALRSLLVHLAKRDAFSELRTKQQLGYIVSLHSGTEHGLGYLEMLVQSNAYDAAELCQRLDDFMNDMLETGLPAKCDLAPAAPTSSSTPASATATATDAPSAATAAADAAVPTGGGSSPAPRTEFEVAVEELAKAKLEKPKKLGDLANRWWSEVDRGTYCFDRQEAEVAQLRSLSPQELLDFADRLLTGGAGSEGGREGDRMAATASPTAPAPAVGAGATTYQCRRLTVQVRGKGEAARAATAASASAAGGDGGGAGASADAAPATTSATAEPAAAAAVAGAPPPPPAATAAPGAPSRAAARRRRPYSLIPAEDPFTWKRGCEVLPSVRALWAARRAAGGGGGGGSAAEAGSAGDDSQQWQQQVIIPESEGVDEVERMWREEQQQQQRSEAGAA